ncbi:MAG: RNA methyltransferase [Bacteroidales bacterium]|nr:RNA methyltransferase [Bacteroidales bacterium]
MPQRYINQKGLFDDYSFEQKEKLYEALSELFSENKRQLFDKLVQNRTRHITVMLEDIYQSHNASAVLRSCDCFGVQDVHVVETHNQFNPAGDVAVGSSKWVDYYKHSDTLSAYNHLHSKGYQIIATLPHEDDTMIGDLDITKPTALVFGTELTGLTQTAIDNADGYVKIPMYGFTESFNISVCAALSLFSTTERMRSDSSIAWQLDKEQQLTLKLNWVLQTIKDGENVVRQLVQRLL